MCVNAGVEIVTSGRVADLELGRLNLKLDIISQLPLRQARVLSRFHNVTWSSKITWKIVNWLGTDQSERNW